MASIFDKILSGELPSAKVYEDERIYVFMDAFPQSKGHTLIIPKHAADDLFSVDPEDLKAIIVFSQKLAKALREVLKPDGIKVVQYNGTAAGQTVFHYHMHLIPVWSDQELGGHGDKSVPLETLEKTAAAIREALA